jgi:AraC-like DNA-binding protein
MRPTQDSHPRTNADDASSTIGSKTAADEILTIAERYICSRYQHALTLTEVAAAIPVSPFYLAHLFRRSRGTTFLKYLTEIRMGEARKILATSSVPVSVVSARVGYLSEKRFRVLFNRAFDVSPAKYRMERQATTDL